MALLDSKFGLVRVSASPPRQINSSFGQLGEGLGASIPPQITSTARKPLSIAFEEMDAGKIVPIEPPDEPEEVEGLDADGELLEGTTEESADDADSADEGA